MMVVLSLATTDNAESQHHTDTAISCCTISLFSSMIRLTTTRRAMYYFAHGRNYGSRKLRCMFCRFPPNKTHLEGWNYYMQRHSYFLNCLRIVVTLTLSMLLDNQVGTWNHRCVVSLNIAHLPALFAECGRARGHSFKIFQRER